MTDKQLLTKAIERAVKNGWLSFVVGGRDSLIVRIKRATFPSTSIVCISFPLCSSLRGDIELGIYDIIFSHDFAKAFWPSPKFRAWACPKCDFCKDYSKHETDLFCPADGRKLIDKELEELNQFWRGHLREMVIEENPLKYLEQFLNEKT